jgi:hypothetical protein
MMGLHRKSYDIATISKKIDLENVVKKDGEVKNSKFITLSRRKCLMVFISISIFSLLLIAAVVVTVTVLLMNNDAKVKNNTSISNNNISIIINATKPNMANLSYFMDLVGKNSDDNQINN